MASIKRMCAAGAFALLAVQLQAQPIPVEGTEMVPNEYGSTFPREITWGADGSRMVLIPYGTFVRGTSRGTAAEGPEREITLPSFYIDKYEVSNASYKDYATKSSAPQPRPAGHESLTLPSHPVTAIPWTAANSYALVMGKQLPTEAMWEKAARGPDNTLYTTGSEPPKAGVVNAGNTTTYAPTFPVDKESGDVSGYGVFHMGGNVAEYCLDWFDRGYYEIAPKDDPQGPEITGVRAVRGGSFVSTLERTRTTWRSGSEATAVREEVGFRTAWVPRPQPKRDEVAAPTPTSARPPKEDPVEKLITAVMPYLESGAVELPKEMNAPGALQGRTMSNVQLVNFTPFRMTVTFLGPKEEVVYRYAEPIAEASFRNVELPADRDLYMIAYAPEAPFIGPVRLGSVRAESRAIIVLKTEMFAPVVRQDGTKIPILKEGTEAEQIYQTYSPMWNHMELFNSLDVPLIVKVAPVISGQVGEMPDEYHVDGKESLRLVLDPGNYEMTADYFGASGPSGKPIRVRIDDKAARRQVIVQEDKSSEEGVIVITQKLPLLKLDLRNVRQIPVPVPTTAKGARPTPKR